MSRAVAGLNVGLQRWMVPGTGRLRGRHEVEEKVPGVEEVKGLRSRKLLAHL